jgi:hypothetical protein
MKLLLLHFVFQDADVALYPLDCGLQILCDMVSTWCLNRRVSGCVRTYVDVLRQELVRDTIFAEHVVVHSCTGSRRSKKETEESVIYTYALALLQSVLQLLESQNRSLSDGARSSSSATPPPIEQE